VSQTKDRLLFTYIVNQTVHWFIPGMFTPVMVLLLLDGGLGLVEVGTVLALYSGTVIVLELPTGGLADAIGRKRVYLAALCVSMLAVSIIMFGHDLLFFAFGFIVYGVARALSSGSIDAWFVDEFKRENPGGDLQKALGKANTFIPLGLALGALVGGLLPTLFGDSAASLTGASRYSATLLVMLALMVVQFGLTSVMIKENFVEADRKGVAGGFREVPNVLRDAIRFGIRDRNTRLLLTAAMALGFTLFSLELLWQPQLKGIIGSDSQSWIFGLVAAGYFVMASLGSLLSGKVCDLFKGNLFLALLAMTTGVSIAIVVMALQNGIIGFVVLYFIVYLMIGLIGSPHAAAYNAGIPSEKRSTLMSFDSLVTQLGGVISSIVLGFVSGAYSIQAAWFIASLVLFIALGAYFALWRGSVRKPQKDARAEQG
jgi:DHA1 family quinolone resistance protein-like MFS transporter